MSSSNKWRHTPIPPAEESIPAEMRKVSQCQLDLWDLITSPWIDRAGVMRPANEYWLIRELRSELVSNDTVLLLVIESMGKPLTIEIHPEEYTSTSEELPLEEFMKAIGARGCKPTRFGDAAYIISQVLEEEVFSQGRSQFENDHIRFPP